MSGTAVVLLFTVKHIYFSVCFTKKQFYLLNVHITKMKCNCGRAWSMARLWGEVDTPEQHELITPPRHKSLYRVLLLWLLLCAGHC